MRSLVRLVAALAIVSVIPGCGIVRSIEQWKCDNWGMCHFGIQPSNPGPNCCGPSPACGPSECGSTQFLPPPGAPELPQPYHGF
jgi:hypothetical protein